MTLSDASRLVSGNINGWRTSAAKSVLSAGQKYYWEVEFIEGDYLLVGIGQAPFPIGSYSGNNTTSYGLISDNHRPFQGKFSRDIR